MSRALTLNASVRRCSACVDAVERAELAACNTLGMHSQARGASQVVKRQCATRKKH